MSSGVCGRCPGGREETARMRFAGRTIVVTGGAVGRGSVMAAALAAEGGNVGVVDRPGSGGAEVAAVINRAGHAGGAFFAECDLADLPAAADLMTGIAASHDGVDVLVNNAAIYPRKAVNEYTIDEWQLVQRPNFHSASLCTRPVLPAMPASASGPLANISSITFFGGLAEVRP